MKWRIQQQKKHSFCHSKMNNHCWHRPSCWRLKTNYRNNISNNGSARRTFLPINKEYSLNPYPLIRIYSHQKYLATILKHPAPTLYRAHSSYKWTSLLKVTSIALLHLTNTITVAHLLFECPHLQNYRCKYHLTKPASLTLAENIP